MGDAATKVTSALGLGGHHTKSNVMHSQESTRVVTRIEGMDIVSGGPTQGNTSKVSTEDLRNAADRERMHAHSAGYSKSGGIRYKPEIEGTMKVNSRLMQSAGPGEKVSEKAGDILHKAEAATSKSEEEQKSLGAKLAAPCTRKNKRF